MHYLGEQHLPELFAYIERTFSRIEEVPAYLSERQGYPKLLGVLEVVQNDTYYPDMLDKVTYLLIAINKGHFFSNGNKRLALVAATTFLALNNKTLRQASKDVYAKLLEGLFPEYGHLSDFEEFTSTDFATYHLSIAIAESGALAIEHDDLKTRVRKFFVESVV